MTKWTDKGPASSWKGAVEFSPDSDEQGGKVMLTLGAVTIRMVGEDPVRVRNLGTILEMVHSICGDEFDVAKLVMALGKK